ncbi:MULTISPECIES: hypothetical protein [unclassified Clostridium]|uniref:hypothetical protein n=1 Tax=unclassified Clostridium TaxID=2614128 RepID=UPI00189960C0|nr:MULTISPECIES: hypothetical protein [unclassified Clostridium]MBP3915057.1 hypothetical protein [Clostridium sp.]MEE0931727.1 hypothetical protein [Clostridium sp.]
MGNKITLTYENGEFNVAINESVVYTDKEMEGALLKFNSVVKNNAIEQNNSWDSIEAEVNSYNIEQVEVNSQFKTVNFGKMKYFYNTDKVFYIQNNSMISLGGGYSLFNFVLKKINEGHLENEESFLELCKISMLNKAIFSANEDIVMISSPKFSYGTVEYNFATNKINKGTSSEKGSFEEFKNYVLEILK